MIAGLQVAEGDKIELALRAVNTDPAHLDAWTTGIIHELSIGGDGVVLQVQYEQIVQSEKELKKLLLSDLDAFTLTFTEKLATYGLRRTTSFGDRDDLKAITAAAKAKDYRLKDIIESFVCSDLFQKR